MCRLLGGEGERWEWPQALQALPYPERKEDYKWWQEARNEGSKVRVWGGGRRLRAIP